MIFICTLLPGASVCHTPANRHALPLLRSLTQTTTHSSFFESDYEMAGGVMSSAIRDSTALMNGQKRTENRFENTLLTYSDSEHAQAPSAPKERLQSGFSSAWLWTGVRCWCRCRCRCRGRGRGRSRWLPKGGLAVIRSTGSGSSKCSYLRNAFCLPIHALYCFLFIFKQTLKCFEKLLAPSTFRSGRKGSFTVLWVLRCYFYGHSAFRLHALFPLVSKVLSDCECKFFGT